MSHDTAHTDAERFLNGESLAEDRHLALPEELKDNGEFGLGLRVFDRLVEEHEPISIRIAQAAVVCAYKDPDVPARDGLRRALEILRQFCHLDESDDPETLGLAGAVYKRVWERNGKPADLSQSLQYYRLGFTGRTEDGPEPQRLRVRNDLGYNAINAAFLADILASNAKAIGETQRAAELRGEADRIRALILEVLGEVPPDQIEEKNRYWFLATRFEAAIGGGDFERAATELNLMLSLPGARQADGTPTYSWMLQSTATQLAKLIRCRYPDPAELRPREILRTLLSTRMTAQAIDALILGKVGLSLSGGGFRAAFFHIGVLARLAELDVLRHVEVLSTVSGGSIVGAQYYLLLKRQLEQTDELGRNDYIAIVRAMETQFLQAVQRDVRSTLYGGLSPEFETLLRPSVAVSQRMGRILEKFFYQPFFTNPPGTAPIYLDQLTVHPGNNDSFRIKRDNWIRSSKVPVLVINATSLNTGHVWQFTATYAGESPYAISDDVDSNDRLRRFYYRSGNVPDRAPTPGRRIELGTAVAASACVPGFFPPVEFDQLYAGYRVRLVDGGVHDNQGVISLLEQDCTQLIVSDACGQMTTDTTPTGAAVAPLMRSNSILMERVRQEEYERIATLRETGRLNGLLLVHLRQDLSGEAVPWTGCEDPRRAPIRGELLKYGIRREYQEALAAMRTDLDAFSEVEAYALMFSGYRMVDRYFANALPDLARLATPAAKRENWSFLAVEGLMTEHPPQDPRHGRFGQLLNEGKKQFFRDSNEEEQRVRACVKKKWRLLKGCVLVGSLLLVVVPIVLGVFVGLTAALWTALGLLVSATAGAAIAITWFRVRKAVKINQFDDMYCSLPALGYGVILKVARCFSEFHLRHYRKQLLDRATIASLNDPPDGDG